MRSALGQLAVAGALLLLAAGCGPDLPSATATRRFPPRDLRGYGQLAGAWEQYDRGAALFVRGLTDDQARLVAAKYVRDLTAWDGLAPTALAPRQAGDAWEVPGQGWVGLRGQGSRVVVLTAATRADLDELAAAVDWPAAAIDESVVPMYLDGWDRYGFRFYYRPWETPPGVKWADYRVLEEFDWARELGRLGFVFWAKPDVNDTGPALTDRQWWDWAARACERRDLPVVLNTVRSAPTWLLNRYRDQVQMKMPQYCGSFHSIAEPGHDGMRQISWCATTATDAEYAVVQQLIPKAPPQTVLYMEPNCELKHGEYDVFLEYGPVADASFRSFLEARYGSPRAVAKRWYGDFTRLGRWEDVHVPELASFAGWGPEALDLTGPWRLAYEDFPEGVTYQPGQLRMMHNDDVATVGAPDEWFAADFDDSGWPSIEIPGTDRQMFLDKRPAVLRREFTWDRGDAPAWLYLWDLNYGKHRVATVRVVLNGTEVGNETLRHAVPHWGAYDLSGALRPGRNVLAVRLPKGVIAYRTYVSTAPPRQYPALGELENARWVDFSDWRRQTRLDTCRRGLEMIRQADPNRGIILASPDGYYTGIRELAQQYGGHFHNTGHMSGFYNDYLPALMRGAELPFSLEPGGPAGDLAGFKKMVGLWLTEGLQGIHYFIHVGNLMWPADIRAHFEAVQPLLRTVGKVHRPPAEVAVLLSNRAQNLSGYPWGTDYNTNLPTGYWAMRLTDKLAVNHHVDAVTDADFAPDGPAARYRIIVDSNTSVMTPATVAAIGAWVRAGGIFITTVQSGRHTPEQPDSWPIAELTGYRVTGIDPHRADGGEGHTRAFTIVDEAIFPAAAWPTDRQSYANGLSLEQVAPECRDLMVWEDGAVAVGLRPLGKGTVVNVGVKFGRAAGAGPELIRLLDNLLDWARVPRLPVHAENVICRHDVSNNGLYDTWTIFNDDANKAVTTRLVFSGQAPPCYDIRTGAPVDPTAEIELAPFETRLFISPRNRLTEAPRDWFALQRGWWQGAAKPAGPPLEVPARPNDRDLTNDWTYRVLPEGDDDQSALAAPDLDDSAWPRRALNCWAVGDELPSPRVFFRRRFRIPGDWTDGQLTIWLRSFFANPVIGKARYWLDGEEIPAGDGRYGLIHHVDLEPGSSHVLAVEIRGEGQVCGVRGNTWLAFTPAPRAEFDLAGDWEPSPDFLQWGDPIPVPGPVSDLQAVHRRFTVPADWQGRGQVYLHMQGGYAITGIIVNGRYLRRHHHNLGDITLLNITPLLRFDDDNDLDIVLPGGRPRQVDSVALRLYDDATSLP